MFSLFIAFKQWLKLKEQSEWNIVHYCNQCEFHNKNFLDFTKCNRIFTIRFCAWRKFAHWIGNIFLHSDISFTKIFRNFPIYFKSESNANFWTVYNFMFFSNSKTGYKVGKITIKKLWEEISQIKNCLV